jgi:hypothetical protein
MEGTKMDTETEVDEVVEKIQDFQNKGTTCYVWGRISGPYDGCFYLNVVGIVKGDKVYFAAEINQFSRYKHLVADTKYPNEILKTGCVKVEDVTSLLSNFRDVEVKSLAVIEEDTPYALMGYVLEMCKELGLPRPEGFKCKICGSKFSDRDDVQFLEGEFRGNGGIGIEVDAPLCMDCFNERHCCNCGDEIEPYQGCVNDQDECIYCADEKTCSECGEKIVPDWRLTEEDIANWQNGICDDCLAEIAEDTSEK